MPTPKTSFVKVPGLVTGPNTTVMQAVSDSHRIPDVQIVTISGGVDTLFLPNAKALLIFIDATGSVIDVEVIDHAGAIPAIVDAGTVALLFNDGTKWLNVSAGAGSAALNPLFTSARVRGVVDANVPALNAFALSGAGRDGITYVNNNIVMLGAQAAPQNNGPYIVLVPPAGPASLVRPDWWETGAFIPDGFTFSIGSEGPLYGGLKIAAKPGGAFKVIDTDDPVLRFHDVSLVTNTPAATIRYGKGGLTITGHPAAGRLVFGHGPFVDFSKCIVTPQARNGGGGTNVTFDVVPTSANAIEIQVYQAAALFDADFSLLLTDDT